MPFVKLTLKCYQFSCSESHRHSVVSGSLCLPLNITRPWFLLQRFHCVVPFARDVMFSVLPGGGLRNACGLEWPVFMPSTGLGLVGHEASPSHRVISLFSPCTPPPPCLLALCSPPAVHSQKQNRQTCVRKSLICAFAMAFIISVMLIAANQILRSGME